MGVAYVAGSKFGEAVYNGVKKVATTAKKVAKTVAENVKEKIKNGREFLEFIFT